MKRREFITLLGGAAAVWPLVARAQQPDKTARVGWLAASLDNPVQALGREVLLSTLRKLGFTEGYNLVLEHRRTDEGMAKAFAGANELVAAKADVLIADGPEIALQAATAARPIVPVVMLANKRVAELARMETKADVLPRVVLCRLQSVRARLRQNSCAAGGECHWPILSTAGVGRKATRTVD